MMKPETEKGMYVLYDTKGHKQLRGFGTDLMHYIKTMKWTVTPPVITETETEPEKKERKSKKEIN